MLNLYFHTSRLGESPNVEAARLLRRIADRIVDGTNEGAINDRDGRLIGYFTLDDK